MTIILYESHSNVGMLTRWQVYQFVTSSKVKIEVQVLNPLYTQFVSKRKGSRIEERNKLNLKRQ